MTRVLCIADVHVGAGSTFGLAPHGPGSRLEDQRAVLQRIAQLAVDEDVDLVLNAGDTFHRPKPTPAEILVVQEFNETLMRNDIPAVIISGNAGHDGVTAASPSPVEILGEPFGRELVVQPSVVQVNLRRGAGLYVACLPGVPPAHLVATRDGGGDRSELLQEMGRMLVDVAGGLRAQCTSGAPAILLLHWSISGTSLPNGLPVASLHEPVLDGRDLLAQGWQGIVAGHIHKHQAIEGWDEVDVPAFYCGSPMVMNWGEESVPHGVMLLDYDGPSDYETRHVPIEDRPFITVEVDVLGADDPMERILSAMDD